MANNNKVREIIELLSDQTEVIPYGSDRQQSVGFYDYLLSMEPEVEYPGDSITKRMTPTGNITTKADLHNLRYTARNYGGTTTFTFMRPTH